MKTKIADLHCHSTFFPRNQMLHTLWHQRHRPIFHSQGDFVRLAKGGTRVLFLTLYPIEQGYMKSGLLGTGNILDTLAKILLRFPKERADEVQDYDHSYFKDLLGEYNLLKDSPKSKRIRLKENKTKKEFSFKVVRNFEDLQNVLQLDGNYNPGIDNIIAIIPTIEGAHSLGTGQYNTLTLDYNSLEQTIKNNIAELKKLGPDGLYCPFFITLSHFFWNQLGGHAVSLWKLFGKPKVLFNQNTGINNGIEKLGELVVNELLSKKNGKRILIDVTHMSVRVRIWYYKTYLPQQYPNEKIPIIVSHTGVNGWKTLSESEILGPSDTVHNYADNRYENSKKFNPWDVFISDEEIIIIHNSGGLIGLALDKRIMMGRKTRRNLRKKTMFKWGDSARKIWIEPFIDQIIHISETIDNYHKSEEVTSENFNIWDNICIGSDYDGMIKPIKGFRSAKYFPELDKMLFEGLKKRRNSVDFLSGKTDYEIREITDKIVWKNALQFLQKHFVSAKNDIGADAVTSQNEAVG